MATCDSWWSLTYKCLLFLGLSSGVLTSPPQWYDALQQQVVPDVTLRFFVTYCLKRGHSDIWVIVANSIRQTPNKKQLIKLLLEDSGDLVGRLHIWF